ncbi:MAG: tetratricopeptide repeat protein, partial [Victivallaceae bacterium]
TGVVRLQLGSSTDEINDVVDSNNTFDIMSQNDLRNVDAFKVPTIIVTGSDQIVIEVVGEEDKVLATRSAQMRTDGTLEIMDNKYISPVEAVHIGQNFYLKVVDPDRDVTADRDEVKVQAKSGVGDVIELVLAETLPHSGIFTGSIKPELFLPTGDRKAPVPGDAVFHSTFGDKIEFTYVDPMPLAGNQPLEIKSTGSIVLGADGEIASFTKRFKDSEMAVKTNFLMAEALFEMAKSHRKLNKEEVANEEISRGKRILEEALRDYPDTSLKAQGEFLLANLAQQLKNYQEAVGRYSIVINRYPESEYAAKAQFQKAQCLENMGQNEQACEEYVRLTYLYPDNPLAADAKVRLGNFYYKNKRYKSAATIFRKFAENHPAHALAARSLFLAAHSELRYLKEMTDQAASEKRNFVADYSEAVNTFEELIKKYDEDKELRAEAMYWLGDTYFNSAKSGNKNVFENSYQVFTTLTFEYPESKWAKMARGRLADVGK